MTNKYAAKHVYWDSKKQVVLNPHDVEIYRCKGKLKLPKHYHRIDSQHEFRVYLELCRMYGEHRVDRQISEELIPPCFSYPMGKRWKIDFGITNQNGLGSIALYIEAKGLFTPAFGDTLAMFELHSRIDINRLFLVFPDKIPTKSLVIKRLLKTDFTSNLLTLKDLKQLTKFS